ncbi:MAG: response regulator transcription factor [Bacteroidetes bacterium]|nr:response regulator transcription factor [Bacteroidota bacterium]
MKNTILIIEDDKDTLDILSYLAEALQIQVIPRSDVLTLKEIEAIAPSLILLDHWINGKLGGSLCKAIKSNPATSHIPIAIISAHNDLGRIAKDCGADTYLNKPFDIDDLTALIEKYMLART